MQKTNIYERYMHGINRKTRMHIFYMHYFLHFIELPHLGLTERLHCESELLDEDAIGIFDGITQTFLTANGLLDCTNPTLPGFTNATPTNFKYKSFQHDIFREKYLPITYCRTIQINVNVI